MLEHTSQEGLQPVYVVSEPTSRAESLPDDAVLEPTSCGLWGRRVACLCDEPTSLGLWDRGATC